MKKIAFILILIVAISAIISVCFIYNYNKENKSDSDFYTKIYSNYNDVDDGVSALIDSKEYKDMNEDERVVVMEKFLKLYESSGAIRNLYYESDNKLYSFTYPDGTLGGVSLKEFNSVFN